MLLRLAQKLIFSAKIVCILSFCIVPAVYSQVTIEKSPNDRRDYYYFTLENGLEIITVSDPNAHVNAVNLLVKAGSFDEPNEWPGLAHYLEHMLFLGTEKYPNLDDFQSFLTAHGGSRNAMTTQEFTQFYFTTDPKGLDGALDRFSQFFIAPLFSPERADKERQAVDSEYQMNVTQDGMKFFEVDQETSNTAHPYHRFIVGNVKTLSGNENQRDSSLREFFKEHYQPQNMILVLVGPQETLVLNEKAKSYFSSLTKQSAQHQGKLQSTLPLVFDQTHKGLDIRIKTKSDLRELKLHFPLPSYQSAYKEKPGLMLALLIGDESEGSLLNFLKKQGWAHALSTEFSRIASNQDRLGLNISLTSTGLLHINDITQAVFNYFKFLSQQPFPGHYFSDYKKLHALAFNFQEYLDPLSLSTYLAQSARLYPVENLLTHGFLSFDAKIPTTQIEEILAALTPKNMRRFLLSPDEKSDRKSKWYQAGYVVENFPASVLRQFDQNRWLSQFQLPPINPYIPEDLTLKAITTPSETPQKMQVGKIMLWSHQENQFGVPKADILVNFVTSKVAESPENVILATLLSQLVADALQEKMYAAHLAGAQIGLYQQSRGLTLTISGFSDKQDLMLKTVVPELINHKIDPQKFYIHKDNLVRNLKNYQHQKLFSKGFTDLNVLITNLKWHPNELLASLKDVTPKKLESFQKELFKENAAEILVNGNYTLAEAKEFGNLLESLHQFTEGVKALNPIKIAKLKQNVIYRLSQQDKNKENFWLGYYQAPMSDISQVAKVALLANILQSPYYEKLRAQEQMGYALGVIPYTYQNDAALVFWLQSPQFSPEKIFEQTQIFMQNSLSNESLWGSDFVSQVGLNMAKELRQPPKTLGEQTMRWWQQIESGYMDFDRHEKLAKAILKEDAITLKGFYTELMSLEIQNKLFITADGNKHNHTKLFSDFRALTQYKELF